MKTFTQKFLVAALFFITTHAYSQDPNFYIYLCFGQSNMEGQGRISQQDRVVNSRFQVMEAVNCSNLGRVKGSWYTAVPPLTRCYNGLSPADNFGKLMVANLPDSIKVGVINVSVAGCKIELYDKTNYQTYVSSVTEDWLKNIINAYGGNPYGWLVDLAKQAQEDGVIKGILLHQGESNFNDNQWPSKVKAIYDTLLNDLGLEANSLPLLAGEVVHADQGGQCAAMNSIIAKLPQSIPNAHVISSSGCTDTTDNLHFNAAGYRELGKRYAVKMLTLMGIEPTAVEEAGIFRLDGFALEQNYPNPFNPETTISFTVPIESFVSLKIFDALGREVAVVLTEQLPAGTHSRQWNAEGLPSGVYFYRLTAGAFTETKKLTLLR